MNTGLVAGSLISIGGSSIGGESNQNNPTINVNALAVAGLLIKNKIQPLGANGTDLNYYQSWVRMELYQSKDATEPISSKSAQLILRDGETNQWKSASLYWEGLEMPDDWCEGFVKIYIENQGDESIWFDDISVEHTHNPGKIEVVSYKDYYPFGAEMRGSCLADQGRYGYQGDYAEKDEETGWNAFELRMYDPLIGRSTSVDPYRQYHSPYMWVGNNPINTVDPDGGNGYQLIASGVQAAMAVQETFGMFLDPVTIYGTSEVIDVAKIAEGENWDFSAFKTAGLSTGALVADDLTGIGVADDIVIPVIWVGATGTFLYNNKEIVQKRAREMDRLLSKYMPTRGVQYTLRAKSDGMYPVYSSGSSVPTGTVFLQKGAIWKIGETTTNTRYSRDKLKNIGLGVEFSPEFTGNRVQIKVMEKAKIYAYYFQHGNLPPGNKIFR